MEKMNKINKDLITDIIDVEIDKNVFAKKYAVKNIHVHPNNYPDILNSKGETDWPKLTIKINSFTEKALQQKGALSSIITYDYIGGRNILILVDSEEGKEFSKNLFKELNEQIDIKQVNIGDIEQVALLNLLINALYNNKGVDLYLGDQFNDKYLVAHKLSFKQTELGLAFINESVTFVKSEKNQGDYDLFENQLLSPNNQGTGDYGKKGFGGPKQNNQLSIAYSSNNLTHTKLYKRFEVASRFNWKYKEFAKLTLNHKIDGWTVFEPKESIDKSIRDSIQILKDSLKTIKISYHPEEKEHAEIAKLMRLSMVGEGLDNKKGEFQIPFNSDQVVIIEEEYVDNSTPTIRLVKEKEHYEKSKIADIYNDKYKNVQHITIEQINESNGENSQKLETSQESENNKKTKRKTYKKKDFKAILLSALGSLYLQTANNIEGMSDFDGWEFYEFVKEDKQNAKLNIIKVNKNNVEYEQIDTADPTNLFSTNLEQDEMLNNKAFYGFKTSNGEYGYVTKLSYGMSEDYEKIEKKTEELIRRKQNGEKMTGTFATGKVAEEHLASLLGIGYKEIDNIYYYYSSIYKKSGIQASSAFTRKPRLYKLQTVSTQLPITKENVEKLLQSMNNPFINVGRNATIPLPIKVMRHCLKYNL